MAAAHLRRTPLYDLHRSLGARMVPFAGWELPIQFSGILAEARAVRARAGLFDVSHMGRLEVRGPDAGALLDRVLSVRASSAPVGRARYCLVCDLEGGIIDDCIVFRRDAEGFLLVPNAANTAAVLGWLERWRPDDAQVTVEDVTARYAMIAHQGPKAARVLSPLTTADLDRLRPFRAVETQVAGWPAFLSRTGYTGEDGFEIIVEAEGAAAVWERLMEGGAEACGLGARDVLRLEAGLPLHGSDIDTTTDPFEAGLGRFVDPDRPEYVAGPVLRRRRERGPARRLVGFQMVGRGVPRHGYAIQKDGRVVGRVTSGGYSPSLDSNIGMGYVPTDLSAPRTRFTVDVRGRPVEAEVVPLPFYSRRKA